MSVKKQKYYVVWHGHHPGIYDSWAKCLAQVKNYPNAIYKAYNSKQEAEEAYESGPAFHNRTKQGKPNKFPHSTDFISESISVDAACSGNPGVMEYRGVWTSDKSEIFHFGPVKSGTNNIGEFLAIVHALALLLKKHDSTTPVYSDSKTAISWVKKKKANTKLHSDKSTLQLFEMIERAENWLKTHPYKNPVLKWETEKWGEIAADFGRK